jgi:CheY-like chemotaxis protein
MVIDDDEISLSLISLLLKSEGYEVIQASSGAAAVKMLAGLAPDVRPEALIADLRMPGLSGSALAIELRQSIPHAKIFAMSATPDAAKGYDGFLKKPLDPTILSALLNGHASGTELPEPAIDNQPDLDEVVYQKMSGMMPPAAVREVYEACVEDARARGREMRVAASADDLTTVRRIAHTLKGSAGMVGARKLAAIAADLELGANEPEQVFKLTGNLLSCCDELHRILLAKIQT